MTARDIVLQASQLNRVFTRSAGLFRRPETMHAVRDLSFELYAGETLGIVGESGCGKSTLARMLVGLDRPSSGSIRLFGTDASKVDGKRAQTIQYVFQDPIASLNPRKTIEQILNAPLRHLSDMDKQARHRRIRQLVDVVGLHEDHLQRYPHEFSGGQAQRIGIARALAVQPRILVLDEPVSALDVSIQAQILKLLLELKREFELSYVFISHDLSVVESVSDRVGVMYFGSLVEQGRSTDLFARPRHPYTSLLLQSAPRIDAAATITGQPGQVGELPNPFRPPAGCSFIDRCGNAVKRCAEQRPELAGSEDDGHTWACFNPVNADAGGVRR